MEAKAISPAPPPSGVGWKVGVSTMGIAALVAEGTGVIVFVGLTVLVGRGTTGAEDDVGSGAFVAGGRVFVGAGAKTGIAGASWAKNKSR